MYLQKRPHLSVEAYCLGHCGDIHGAGDQPLPRQGCGRGSRRRSSAWQSAL
nr:MAG TPA: hypothetical protein [Caudoviricetes sp.]